MLNFIWNFIKNFFPIKTKSVTDFFVTAEKHSCDFVEAKVLCNTEDCAETIIATIGTLNYILKLSAYSPLGRTIICGEQLYEHEQEGMEIPIAFAEEKTKAGIKAYLLAEARVKELQNSTKIQIFLITPSGKQMNNTTLMQLHDDADTYNVSIYES